MNRLSQYFKDHAAAFVIGAIALIAVILTIIIVTLVSTSDSGRKIVIDDIRGNAFILKSDGQISADKKMTLLSGDVLITSSSSSVRLSVDKDKYIYVEPETTVYIYYTELAEKGSIVVNISEGAVTCRLDSKLSSSSAFEVRTPNAVVSAAGTIFRTQFDYFDNYGGYSEVKVTESECIDGTVTVQLYDNEASPVDQLMRLAEKKSARLVTSDGVARYEYLNSDIKLNDLTPDALDTLIRIAAERNVSFPLAELNAAYQTLLNRREETVTSISTMYPPAEETTTASSAVITTAKTTTAASASTSISETISEESVSESSSLTESPETSAVQTTASTTTVSSEMSVTSPSTVVYTVSHSETTSQQTTETVSTAASVPAVTTVPPIKPAESVTATTSVQTVTAATTAEQPVSQITTVTLPPVTTVSKRGTSVPWWEIVNSAALTASSTH